MDDIKFGLIVAQLINFWILFFLFKKFLADKLITAIKERKQFLEASNKAEDEAKQKIDEAVIQSEKIIDEARKKASEIESYAEEISKSNAAKAMEKAEKEAEHILQSGKANIEKQQLEMVANMKSKVIDLALKLNNKVFWKQEANKDFMESQLDILTK